ncbi:MAG: hypothetical protein ISR68_00300 [Campylobacterales bacterium]|nr:hypothetical protein [Campylobacterales bacterium]
MLEDYYLADDFSPQFYIKLAKAGFISTSTPYQGMILLLPEIQKEYAILDFENLHISKKSKKLLSKKEYKITINTKLEQVINKIQQHHKQTWISLEYEILLKQLSKFKDQNFELISFELNDLNDKLISGEIGYIIGKTYTSLTGFYDTQYSGYGNLQLILLGQYLEENNFDFWNLGHTCPNYKFELGAKVYKRDQFLKRWLKSIN